MRLVNQHRFHQTLRERPDGSGPLQQPRWGPLAVSLVGLGLMAGHGRCSGPLLAPHMRGYAFASMEHLYRSSGVTDLHLLLHQLIRHGVIVPVEFDVIVQPDAFLLPFGEYIRL